MRMAFSSLKMNEMCSKPCRHGNRIPLASLKVLPAWRAPDQSFCGASGRVQSQIAEQASASSIWPRYGEPSVRYALVVRRHSVNRRFSNNALSKEDTRRAEWWSDGAYRKDNQQCTEASKAGCSLIIRLS